jgi:eukaryotic-like serine/threonine-protein kinase
MKFTHQPGATPVDGFTIRRGIHRGGFGEVYYAVSDAGKEVALKLLQHDQDIELRGVTQCLNLKHPNLVNLFDVRTDSHGEQWVVMEYVNGTSLEDVLSAFPNGLPLDEVRDWLKGLAAGVSHLHDRGIVHRDLKPANVYRENGIVKVGDVGLSKKLGSDRRGAHTQSVGTVYYMAPEVAKGQYGPELDVYSLGIMLYELLTGRVPFDGETTAEILMKHLTAKPDLSRLPESLRPVVAHALEKDPSSRTPSAAQLFDEFERACDGNVRSASSKPAPLPSESSVLLGDRLLSRSGVSTSFVSATQAYAASVPPIPPAPPTPPPVPANSGVSPSSRSERARVHAEPTRTVRVRPSTTGASDRRRWLVVAVVVVGGLIVFSPGTPRAWVGLGLMGLAVSAALFMRSPGRDPNELEATSEPAASRNGTRTEFVGSARSVRRTRSAMPLGSLLSRDALREMSYSLTFASLFACLLSLGMNFASEFLRRETPLPTVELMSLSVAIVMIGAWALILANQCVRRTSWGDRHPRLVNLVAGVLVGSLAFGLDEFLQVDYPYSAGVHGAFHTLGVHPLTVDRLNPTWLGYVVFFGGLFFLRRWRLDADPQRTTQFGVWRLFTAFLWVAQITAFFDFPALPAFLWAILLSATIQLASPWSPTGRSTSFWRS